MRRLKGAPDATDTRSITPTEFINFPSEIDPSKYKAVGYFQGFEHCNVKGFSTDLFDVVSFLHVSECQQSKVEVLHCIGYRGREKKTTVLTMLKRRL